MAKGDIGDIERTLADAAGALLVDPRLLRRVIKAHRAVSGVVPHARCYAIAKDDLAAITEPELDSASLPERVILLARPSPREIAGRDAAETMTRLWRAVFHARVHIELDARVAAGALDEAALRKRIDRIGQIEFDEIRAILRHDDRVMPPADDREVYIEFAALYLELKSFAPGLLVTTFPGLGAHQVVSETLALDIDVAALLNRGKPAEVAQLASTRELGMTSMPSFSAPETFGGRASQGKPVSAAQHARYLEGATRARDKYNDVRAALLCSRATSVEDRALRKVADQGLRAALKSLGDRLSAALGVGDRERPDWGALLRILADRATEERFLRYAVEARLLYELQRAAVGWERVEGTVDVASWVLTRGEKAIVRDLGVTRELRVARHLRAAAEKIRHVRVSGADRKMLAKLIDWANERAEANMRAALKPLVDGVLDRAKLVAESGPEALARDKVVEELLDQIIDAGFLSFDALRDSVSRNMVKLDDLSGARELWDGDTLLRIDAELSRVLDGIYRRADIYLRVLQKLSSLPFGTGVGRAATLYVVLPVGGAYVLLEGVAIALHLVTDAFAWPALEVVTLTSMAITTALVFALVHSAPFRALARQLLDIVALILATVFLRLPRAIMRRPEVRRWFARPGVRLVVRRVLLPGAVAAGVYAIGPLGDLGWWVPLLIAFGVYIGGSFAMGSRLGAWLEDFVFDQVAPTWHVLSRQWLPGTLRLVTRFFAALMDLLMRGMYAVDELLRYRQGQSAAMKALKGVAGLIWAAIAYVIRLYVTLLVEPMINPVKHFPTVTVADKLMLPFFPAMIDTLSGWFAPLGALVAGTFAALTVFLLPSIFGFLFWELKENYKLYRATRSDSIPAAPVGPHGETMSALLVVGLHSGTLPKLYERLRRAAQREDEAGVVSWRKHRVDGQVPSLGSFRAGIRRVELAVGRFVERELIALLERCPRWEHGDILLDRVEVSSNRIRIQLASDASDDVCVINIEEQSGWIVAGIAEAGFVRALSPFAALVFENALAGFYQRAEVDLVREQLEVELGQAAHYDISDDGLIVWPGSDYRTELVYPIDKASGALQPSVRGEPPAAPPRVIDTRRMFYRDQAISWLAWVSAWTASEHATAEVPRLLRGVSLLPAADADNETPTPLLRSLTPGPDPQGTAVTQVMAPDTSGERTS